MAFSSTISFFDFSFSCFLFVSFFVVAVFWYDAPNFGDNDENDGDDKGINLEKTTKNVQKFCLFWNLSEPRRDSEGVCEDHQIFCYFSFFQDVKCVNFFCGFACCLCAKVNICLQNKNKKKKLFEFIGIHTLKDFVSQLIHQDNVNLKTSTKKKNLLKKKKK